MHYNNVAIRSHNDKLLRYIYICDVYTTGSKMNIAIWPTGDADIRTLIYITYNQVHIDFLRSNTCTHELYTYTQEHLDYVCMCIYVHTFTSNI